MSIIEDILLLTHFKHSINAKLMENKIIPALWFDNNAKEALDFYCDILPHSSITKDNGVAVEASLMGVNFIGINGGNAFKPNPSISFMIVFENRDELDLTWNGFLEEGKVLMPLQEYPFSAHYGWIADKFGVSWQLYLGKLSDVNEQSIIPTLMFAHTQQGNCERALAFYADLFKNFHAQGAVHYPEGPMKGQVMHAQFQANNTTMAAMDSGVEMDFTFTEGVSLTILCKDQAEIDYYWDKIIRTGSESRCGWCKDEFGVSWQVVPNNIAKLLQHNKNAEKALMGMKKIVISELENA